MNRVLRCFVLAWGVAHASASAGIPVIELVPRGVSSVDANVVVFDFAVTEICTGATQWTTGGLNVRTEPGATLRLPAGGGVTVPDPGNTGDPVLRDVTFVNLPSQQNGTQRFGNPGAPGAASYLEGPGAPTVTDSYVDVGFFDTPGGLQPTVGNFIRIAIDVAASGVAPGDVYAAFGANQETPTGHQLLATGQVVAIDNAFVDPVVFEQRFLIAAVPEPDPLTLLGGPLLLVLLLRRR